MTDEAGGRATGEKPSKHAFRVGRHEASVGVRFGIWS